MMKESVKYLNFFQRNWLVWLLMLILGSMGGYWYAQSRPIEHSVSRLYVLDESKMTGNEGLAKLDQAVGLVRAEQMRGELGLVDGSQLIVYKNSPLSIYSEVSSGDLQQSKLDLMKVNGYLLSNYPVMLVGDEVQSQSSAMVWRTVLMGLAIGWLGGLLISLSREYFRYF